MIVTDTKYYNDLEFSEYLKMPGTSFSSLKGSIPESEGMKLGTRVHQYISEPEKYDWQQPEIVLPIARALKAHIGDAFQYLQKEVAFTANFEVEGMQMKYRGRVDLLCPGRIVIDFKVLAGSLDNGIKAFGYDKAISGYCLGTHTPMGLIVAYNKLKKQSEIKVIRPDAAFWEYQVLRMGEPIK